MKNRLYVLFLVLLMIIGPSACGLFQSCPEVFPYFQIEGLDLTHQRFNDDSYGDPTVPNEKIPWTEYGLSVDFKSIYHADKIESVGGANLYALSCAEDGFSGTKVGVDTLYLVAMQDFNETYAKNDTLNNIIQINDWFSGPAFYDLGEYLNDNDESIRFETFAIKLLEGPDVDKTMDFELTYILKNGEQFKQNSGTVNLRK